MTRAPRYSVGWVKTSSGNDAYIQAVYPHRLEGWIIGKYAFTYWNENGCHLTQASLSLTKA